MRYGFTKACYIFAARFINPFILFVKKDCDSQRISSAVLLH